MLRTCLLTAFLLLLVAPAKAVNQPYRTNECASPRFNAVATPSTVSCTMRDVVAGRTILVWGVSSNTITVSSPTQALTCPASSVGTNGGGSTWQVRGCYVVLSSNYTDFTVTTTSAGGVNRAIAIIGREMVGLGAFDIGCGAPASSCSLTTANANEWLELAGFDVTDDLLPHTGFFSQIFMHTETNTTVATAGTAKEAVWYQITGTAGSYTAQYDQTASTIVPTIAAMAFQQSSPPPLPAQVLVQTCYFAWPNTTRTSGNCTFHNYTANNAILFAYATEFDNVGVFGCTGPNVSCPSNSQIMNTYAGQVYITGAARAYDTVNQSKVETGVQMHSGVGQTVLMMQGGEWSGITDKTIDVPSEAAAAALTTNYTTTNNNEPTIVGCFDIATNPLGPVGTPTLFQAAGGWDQNTSPNNDQFTLMFKLTASSGSNSVTCSMTGGGSTRPMIATLSLGPIPVSTSSRRKQAQIF